ncbi:Uncharacterised protein [Mycobacteroides abscessus]|nr:Uncharacterised protein [Mycobacteroides abscessus]
MTLRSKALSGSSETLAPSARTRSIASAACAVSSRRRPARKPATSSIRRLRSPVLA